MTEWLKYVPLPPSTLIPLFSFLFRPCCSHPQHTSVLFSLKHTFLINQGFQDHVTLSLKIKVLPYICFSWCLFDLKSGLQFLPPAGHSSKHGGFYAPLHCCGGWSFSNILHLAPWWLTGSYFNVHTCDYKYWSSPLRLYSLSRILWGWDKPSTQPDRGSELSCTTAK